MSYLPGKFVWFEHMSSDVPKARKFYEQLFAWHTEVMPMGDKRYSMIHNGDEGIGGYTESPAGVPNHWIGYVSVPDVDQTHAAALAAGAKQLMAPTDFGPIGRGSAIKDPTGAPFCLWKSKDGDRPDAPQAPVGSWCWNELWTPDEQTALAFYEKVFGYTHDTMDMGEQGTYYLLKKDGVSRAGLMRSVEPKAPPMWLPYVAVADCDASAAKAKSLGGQVVYAPHDIPNVGRFSVLVDPIGAAIAIIKLAPMAS
ncbi:MAG TPA: VOC family protein [Burkholderiaceae bacterium]|nr:VOC family protein [Burkholderiaceae bacterium]